MHDFTKPHQVGLSAFHQEVTVNFTSFVNISTAFLPFLQSKQSLTSIVNKAYDGLASGKDQGVIGSIGPQHKIMDVVDTRRGLFDFLAKMLRSHGGGGEYCCIGMILHETAKFRIIWDSRREI